ncbi:uncharacterized protein BO96DRAFT_437003 [Aspergillus niger CBS 101883]|uniref:Contig An07c0230, genomic contig n=2 Tax=Aspergillus niger TaxID=5061 RepID=A2QP33_ASPNC|nr:uncharacterized protein BO96DRAFT_437003 [Aspergillus niger CBS 101883]XP_059601032.1 uncharacterized protein An07g08040 [Aspergillus niger]PYH53373.1 hypothetical protein BO96DRAFT_437003 [Aspergillus niger CBS 101883]CAK39620.1 unnamed protein product [Aspergillus niger]
MPKLDLIRLQGIVTDNRQPLQHHWDHAWFSSPIAVRELLIGTSSLPRCILFAHGPARDVSARSHHLAALLFPALEFPTSYFVSVAEKPGSESVLRQSYGSLHVLRRPSVAALHHR